MVRLVSLNHPAIIVTYHDDGSRIVTIEYYLWTCTECGATGHLPVAEPYPRGHFPVCFRTQKPSSLMIEETEPYEVSRG